MNNVMQYKGYWAKIQYSDTDKCFWGEIEGINDMITFEGTSVEDLKKDFEEALDEYIEWCKEEGVEPQKQYNGNFNIRIKPELHREASLLSKIKNISLNKFVENAIQRQIQMEKNQL